MATQARMYGYALWAAMIGSIVWGTASKCKVALMKSTYSPNQDTDEKWEDISSFEISDGSGYTAGGKALTWAVETDLIVYKSGNTPGGFIELKADDITWTGMSKSGADGIRTAVVYYDDGTGYSQPLIGYILWDSNANPNSQDFTIEWTNGVVGVIGLEGETSWT